MAATRDKIREWVKDALEKKASHLIVMRDIIDTNDYPVIVKKSENVKEKIEHFENLSNQKMLEVYNLSKDIETQISCKNWVVNY
jgi:aspartyl/asparaginyl-tRNA synthetase